MRGIFLALLKTAAITYPVSLIINLIADALYQSYSAHDFGVLGLLLVVGTLYITVILLVISLPALFLTDGDWWAKPALRLSLFFGGPLLFVLVTLFATVASGAGDASTYLIIGVVYLFFQTIFYRKLLRK